MLAHDACEPYDQPLSGNYHAEAMTTRCVLRKHEYVRDSWD